MLDNCLLTAHNVVANNLHVTVPVGSRVLVPKSHDMAQLVHDNAKFVAVLSNAYCLRPIAPLADKRATPN